MSATVNEFISPQRRAFLAGRAGLRSETERLGYALAHESPTMFCMRLPAERRIEVLQFALGEVRKASSKIAQKKARGIVRRLKELGAGAQKATEETQP